MWFGILKMPKPRTPDPTKEEYEQMSSEEKRAFHVKMRGRARYHKNKEGEKFHRKMEGLARRGETSYYSIQDAPTNIVRYAVTRGRTETKEEYAKMSDEEKGRFHSKMRERYRRENKTDYANFHHRMLGWIKMGREDTYYSPVHAPELPKKSSKWASTTREEYEKLPYGEKIKFHRAKYQVAQKKNNTPLYRFHRKMAGRLASGGGMLTAFSPRIYDMWYGDIPEPEPQEIQTTPMPKEWEKYMKKSWFEILKGKIKMHLPTVKIKVAEWVEMNREGRHKPQEIIDYIIDDVLAASIDNWIKKTNPSPRSIAGARNSYKRKLEQMRIDTWMSRIAPTLKKLGFRVDAANTLEREEGYSGVMWQDENDWKRQSEVYRREAAKRFKELGRKRGKYEGSAQRWDEDMRW